MVIHLGVGNGETVDARNSFSWSASWIIQYNRNDIEFDARQLPRARRYGGGLAVGRIARTHFRVSSSSANEIDRLIAIIRSA